MRTRIKIEYKKASIADVVSEAFSELTALSEEMQEAFDNLPENLQQTARNQTLQESAETLSSISEVDVPDGIDGQIEYPIWTSKSRRHGMSRATRRDWAVAMMDVVIDYAQGRIDEIEEAKKDDEEDSPEQENLESLRDELENAKDEAEAVEFPGMYG